MSDPIRWGILAAARFAREQMGPAIHAAKGAELAALATASPGKAEGFLAFCPGLRVHGSYEALLADPGIDAVYIPLPHTLHVEWSIRALEAGKHVLVEKPVAMRAAEIDPLIAARDRTGLLAAEAYMIVHHPQWQHARALLRDGAIGRLIHVGAFFTYDNSADPENIRNRPDTGGGSLPDIGVYTCGSTRWMTGEEPLEVRAEITRENGVEVTTHMRARFPSFSFTGTTSMRMHPRQEMVFHGEKGVIRLTAPFNAGVFGQAQVELHRGMNVSVERFPSANHYVLQVEAFGRSIREGAPYPWTLENARGTQAMLDMAWASEAAGRG
jgi:predicted dehydrogenase